MSPSRLDRCAARAQAVVITTPTRGGGASPLAWETTVQLILYGKADCYLCDRLAELVAGHLDELRRRSPGGDATVIKRDISDNPTWEQRYRNRIPVLTVGDDVILEGRPEPDEVARALRQL